VEWIIPSPGTMYVYTIRDYKIVSLTHMLGGFLALSGRTFIIIVVPEIIREKFNERRIHQNVIRTEREGSRFG
jgi:hypothetical protein